MFRSREQIVADDNWARHSYKLVTSNGVLPCPSPACPIPPTVHLVGHDIPPNPHVRLADCRRVENREVEVGQDFNLEMLSLLPDGCLIKEFKEGGRLFKCNACQLFDDDHLFYSCVNVFGKYNAIYKPNLAKGYWASGNVQEQKCWHFCMHSTLSTFVEDSKADCRYLPASNLNL
jgi:hypothetical protein